MNEDLFGSLTVRMQFTKHQEGTAFYGREARLIAFHGSLEDCKTQYKAWLGWNPQLIDMVHGTFEVRMAVHQTEL